MSDPSDASAAKTPDTIEIDPSLTNSNNNNNNNVPQNPIPAFSGMDNGRWPKDDRGSIVDRMRQNPTSGRFFGSVLMQDMLNNDNMTDLSLSPDIGGGASSSSDRPTPNSGSTPAASDRQRTTSNGGGAGAGGDSIRGAQQQQQQQRGLSAMFDDMPGGVASSGRAMATGLTPGRQFGGAPETPKDVADGGAGAGVGAGDFSWENLGAGAGLTPMSEGVLRTMLQMGPMETMDLGWDNPP